MYGVNAVLHYRLNDQRLACVRGLRWLLWLKTFYWQEVVALLSWALLSGFPSTSALSLSWTFCPSQALIFFKDGFWVSFFVRKVSSRWCLEEAHEHDSSTSVCWSHRKMPCVTSWHGVSSTSSAVRIFLCLLAVEEGKVPTNEAGDSLWCETDWLGLLCK